MEKPVLGLQGRRGKQGKSQTYPIQEKGVKGCRGSSGKRSRHPDYHTGMDRTSPAPTKPGKSFSQLPGEGNSSPWQLPGLLHPWISRLRALQDAGSSQGSGSSIPSLFPARDGAGSGGSGRGEGFCSAKNGMRGSVSSGSAAVTPNPRGSAPNPRGSAPNHVDQPQTFSDHSELSLITSKPPWIISKTALIFIYHLQTLTDQLQTLTDHPKLSQITPNIH